MTPEARMIIGRARQSFLFSIGILIVGFIVIGGALVYRSMQAEPAAVSANNEYGLASVSVPVGAQVVSVSAAGGIVTVTYTEGSTTRVRIFDGGTGAMMREFPIESK